MNYSEKIAQKAWDSMTDAERASPSALYILFTRVIEERTELRDDIDADLIRACNELVSPRMDGEAA